VAREEATAAATAAADRVGAAREEAKVEVAREEATAAATEAAERVGADLVGARAAGEATEAAARRSAPRPPAAAQP
jgi:hypothetical protein